MKNKLAGGFLKVVTVLALAAILCTLLVACKPVKYKIYFDPGYEGATVLLQYYGINGQIDVPEVSREGYKFEGWFSKETNKPFKEVGFWSGIKDGAIFYAQWTALPKSLSATYKGEKLFVGDSVSAHLVEATVTYHDGTQKTVADITLDATQAIAAGEQSVNVSYTENGTTVQCSFVVNVFAVVPQSLMATYNGPHIPIGGTLDNLDISATVTMNNGTTKTVQNFSVSGFDSATVGNKTVNVSYTENGVEVSATVYVSVDESVAALVGISVEYGGGNIYVGDDLDMSQLTVTATYDDESSRIVTNFAVGGFSSAVEGSFEIEISYTENGVTETDVFTVVIISGGVVANSSLSVHFLELGNKYTGDCVYIKAGDTDVLIDAGSRYDSASTITRYVDQYCTDGILEYVVVTHAHQDHIAGFVGSNSAEGIFKHYEVENIIQFAQTGSSTETYKSYCNVRDEEVKAGANLYTAKECIENKNGAQKVYDLTEDGTIQMEILDQKYYYSKSSNENNNSVCLMINQGENHYLFTGDLEEEGEKSLVEKNPNLPEMVLYKGGHHGSYTAASTTLMSKIKPQYVCICTCCGTTEYTTGSHTFPAQEFIDRIAKYTDNVYITTLSKIEWKEDSQKWVVTGYQSMNGNIVFSCNNGVISLNCSNNNTKLKDTDWFKNNRTCPAAWQ